MSLADLQAIIDAIFAEIESGVQKPFVKWALELVHHLIISALPSLLGSFGAKSLSASDLGAIIDQIFATLEASATKPMVKFALEIVHHLIMAALPGLLGKLLAKGLVK